MCGIAGYFASLPLDGPAMTEALSHRGPDGHGHYEERYGDRKLYLGHTRLRIIDLSDQGAQPMASNDGQVQLIYNGEVYNFRELRKQFLSGTPFRSTTDTEVLLRLYEQQGIDFLQHLNGDFALSILDRRARKLFLVRDRAGVKPLYLWQHNGQLAFASEIKSLIRGGVPAEPAPEQWPRFFAFKYVPGQETLYKNIRRIPPGHYFEVDLVNGRSNTICYWKPEPQPEYQSLSFSQAADKTRELVGDAVHKRLVSDVPVGSFLSGGLDSSIIASHLRDMPDIRHYVAVKSKEDLRRERTTSDGSHAQLLADKWGLNLSPINIGHEEAREDLIGKTIYYGDDLIADGSQIPSYLITKAAGEHSRVILTGMGADELFLGYAGHMITLMGQYLDRLPGPIARGMAGWLARRKAGKGRFQAYNRYLVKLGTYFNEGNLRPARINVVGDFNSALSLFRNPERSDFSFLENYFPGKDPFSEVFRFEWDNFLVKNLHYMDRMAMANSVETRVPFLDHRLVEFALSLPRSYKLSPSLVPKRILKAAYKDVLPKAIVSRRKAGFGMPLRSIFSDPKKVEELVPVDFFGHYDAFSPEGIQAVIDQQLSGKGDQSALLYALASWRLWVKNPELSYPEKQLAE